MSQKLEQLKHSILATLSEIQRSDLGGLNEPDCREVFDIVCRIERRLLAAKKPKRKRVQLPASPGAELEARDQF